MLPSIGVSIINYKTAALTIACVQSVLADIGDLPVRIVVVDNASGDGSAEHIATWIAEQPADTPIELIRSGVNTGFSGGHNMGMSALDTDWYLLLNSDGVLRRGFLKALQAAAGSKPDIGMITPQIETDDGNIQVSCFRFHSPWSELIRGAGSGPVTRILKNHVVALQPPVNPEQIEWASFACILLNARMVKQIGPMDEGYFLYFEDAEYCLRARRAGWSIAQDTQAVMVHYRGGSGPVKALEQARKRLPPYFYASRTRFYRQAYGIFGPWLANLMWSAGRLMAQVRQLLGKPAPRRIEAEPRDIWTNALRPLGPRRAPGE
ncbi:glycosyltransferase family 2 protein [Rhodobacteraceae bacterium F11138]|nr:glycosyltransferase family 2 protein [Rhodobacteraceae bacterium F11138]